MKLSTALLAVGTLSILASIYLLIQAKSWETILPGFLCGVSLTYFGIIEFKKEKKYEDKKTEMDN